MVLLWTPSTLAGSRICASSCTETMIFASAALTAVQSTLPPPAGAAVSAAGPLEAWALVAGRAVDALPPPPLHAARRTVHRTVESRSRVRMAGILASPTGTVPGTFVARQRPTSTTGLRSSPIPSIVITTSSPAWRVNDSGGTTPVPVMR